MGVWRLGARLQQEAEAGRGEEPTAGNGQGHEGAASAGERGAVPPAGAGGRPHLLLVDGSSLLHRAFFALPALSSPQGQPTGAVYGFLMMLVRLLEDEHPTHVAVALDRPEPTFRHEAFAAYKAQRAEMPAELRSQIPLFRQALAALRIATVDHPAAEADDVLGTLATRAAQAGWTVAVVSGDKDVLQLVGGPVTALLTRRGITDLERMDAQAVRARYGIAPEQVPDLKALMGDASDNIPGVPAVGEKTAGRLIAAYGSVEGLLQRLAEVGPPRVRDALRSHAEAVRRNLRLCTIARDLPLELSLEELRRRSPDPVALGQLLESMGARALRTRLGLEAQATAASPAVPESAASVPAAAEPAYAAVARVRLDGPALGALLGARGGPVAAACVAEGRGSLTALGVYWPEAEGGRVYCWQGDAAAAPRLPELTVLWAERSKPLCHWVLASGSPWRTPAFDAELAAYVLDPGRTAYPLADACQQFGVPRPREGDVAEAAVAVAALVQPMGEALRQHGLWRVFQELELPLVVVLAAMEQAGVSVDRAALDGLERELAARIGALEQEIWQDAGGHFNVNSTQQLARVLFEQLGLKPPKKTKTGLSTDAEVLETLALEHPLPAKVLEYRMLQKLQSTYVQGLRELIGPDGRVHTTFQQTVAVTGRLASQNPNLQNIPVREAIGRSIRRAFVAPQGCVLVAADYSQIELRILAHLAGDEGLVEAFRHGADIHRRTAAEVWGVPVQEVTEAQRTAAKAVNFGIVYGISEFGLARQLGCAPSEAHAIIDRYFQRYPGVKRYLDGVVEEARQRGMVRTMYGRLRRLPLITSRNRTQRAFAERMAMNSPIQGTAADIIKQAMIRAYDALQAKKLSSRLILQVHDELIFEVPLAEVDAVARLARQSMEGAAALAVPLHVDIQVGPNWMEMGAWTGAC